MKIIYNRLCNLLRDYHGGFSKFMKTKKTDVNSEKEKQEALPYCRYMLLPLENNSPEEALSDAN